MAVPFLFYCWKTHWVPTVEKAEFGVSTAIPSAHCCVRHFWYQVRVIFINFFLLLLSTYRSTYFRAISIVQMMRVNLFVLQRVFFASWLVEFTRQFESASITHPKGSYVDAVQRIGTCVLVRLAFPSTAFCYRAGALGFRQKGNLGIYHIHFER